MFRLLLLLVFGFALVPAKALTVRPPTFNELVDTADVIVRGEVTKTETVLRGTNENSAPFTFVTIEVAEVLKGAPGNVIVLQCLGGTVGSRSMHVVGVPEFTIGDRGFFFVQNNGTQFFPLVGITHGLYWTIRDDRTGMDFVARSNGQPLRSVAEVAQPIAEIANGKKLTPRAEPTALTSTAFAAEVKNQLSHVAR